MPQSASEALSLRSDGSPDFERARAYALGRLERELPPALCYHSLNHTRDDVVVAIDRLAAAEGVTGEALLLLRNGGLFSRPRLYRAARSARGDRRAGGRRGAAALWVSASPDRADRWHYHGHAATPIAEHIA